MQELAPRFADGAAFVPLEDVDTAEQFGLRLAREGGIAERARPRRPAGAGHRGLARPAAAAGARQLRAAGRARRARSTACCRTAPRLKILVTSRLRLAVAGEWSMPVEGLPSRTRKTTTAPSPSTRCACSSTRRGASSPTSPRPPNRRHRRHLPPGRGAAAGARARRRPGRACCRAGPSPTSCARAPSCCAPPTPPPAAPRQHRGGVRALVAAPAARSNATRCRGCRSSTAASRSRRRARSPAPRCRCWARWPTSRCWPRTATRCTCIRWCSSCGPAARRGRRARLDRGRPRGLLPPLAAPARAGDRERRPRGAAGDRHASSRTVGAPGSSRSPGQGEALTLSLPTLLNYFEHRARFDEGLALLRQAIESPLAADRPLPALLLSQAALMEVRLARYAEAEATASRALAAARGGRRARRKYQALAVLGGCALFTGRPAEGREAYQQVLALARPAGGRTTSPRRSTTSRSARSGSAATTSRCA